MSAPNRLFVKVTRENLPQIKDRYPFLYLERGRLEVDDSSVKWVDSDGAVIPLPVATIAMILLGPGTSVTHDAIRTIASSNCTLAWGGEDSLLFYSAGFSSTSDSRNFKKQIEMSCSHEKSLLVARKMFAKRFPDADLSGKKLKEMMGMEGLRVRGLYQSKATQYGVGWKGRTLVPGKFELSDTTNQMLTAMNASLYGLVCSVIHSMGYSPHAGFIHSGSPLPFVYDIADLYKESICIDLAFLLTRELAGKYDKQVVSSRFRDRVLKMDLLAKIPTDLQDVLDIKS